MRLKSLWPNVLHGMCIGAILFLVEFVVRETWGNPVDADLQQQMLDAMDAGFSETMASGQTSFKKVAKNASVYPNPMTADYLERARNVKDRTIRVLMLLDSASQKPTATLLNLVQEELQVFRSEASAKIDLGSLHTAVVTSKFENVDWLLQSWKNDSRRQFASVLAKAKLDVGIIATTLLLEFQDRTTDNCGMRLDRHCVGFRCPHISDMMC